MNSQDLNNLQEAYLEVYQLDEDKRPIYGRGGAIRKTETPLQIYGKQATAKDKRTKHNIPKGGTTIDKRDPDELFSGDYDRGSGNAAKRRAAALTKPEATRFPNRLTRSDKQGIKDSYEYHLDEELTGERKKRALEKGYDVLARGREGSSVANTDDANLPTKRGGSGPRRRPKVRGGRTEYAYEADRGKGNKAAKRASEPNESFDLYDIILSHLLDEGYAETQEAAEAIMVNMSEDWRESIMEGMKPLPQEKMKRKIEDIKSSMKSTIEKSANEVGMNPKRVRFPFSPDDREKYSKDEKRVANISKSLNKHE